MDRKNVLRLPVQPRGRQVQKEPLHIYIFLLSNDKVMSFVTNLLSPPHLMVGITINKMIMWTTPNRVSGSEKTFAGESDEEMWIGPYTAAHPTQKL